MSRTADFTTMAELRAEIDRVDSDLVEILAWRQQLIDRAIALKPGEGLPARIETRVEDVVAKVRARSVLAGLDPELAEMLWRAMMDAFIHREEQVLGKGDQQ